MEIPITEKMRERMAAGLSFMYTTQGGHTWYVDAELSFPFRQIDFAEATYCIYDGKDFQALFPSLSVAQEAMEADSIYWRGQGWYMPHSTKRKCDGEPVWCDEPGQVRDIEQRIFFDDDGVYGCVLFGGSGNKYVELYR